MKWGTPSERLREMPTALLLAAQSRRGLGGDWDAGTSGFSPLVLEANSYAFNPEPALSKPVASSLEGVSISIVSRE